MNKAELVARLGLEPHREGGYFRRTFVADHRPPIDTGVGERYLLSSIYYLLTDDAPVGHWHLNHSDILHCWQLGSALDYFVIRPDGHLETCTLGSDLAAGQQLQLMVTGGSWKASRLRGGEYGLISEAVAPGFVYEDMVMGECERLLDLFPQHEFLIREFSLPATNTR